MGTLDLARDGLDSLAIVLENAAEFGEFLQGSLVGLRIEVRVNGME